VTDDEGQIRQLIARFANSFDLKAWDALRKCLAESLRTDYSDLRGCKPEIVSRERFVGLRRRALDSLKTHHLTGYPDHRRGCPRTMPDIDGHLATRRARRRIRHALPVLLRGRQGRGRVAYLGDYPEGAKDVT